MKIFLNKNYILVALVLVLWSIGRILNPIKRVYQDVSPDIIPTFLSATTLLYIILHGLVLVYGIWLFVRALPDFLKKRKTVRWWEITLYVYVIIMTLTSLYFLAYEFGV